MPHSRPPDAPIGCGGEGLRCCTRLCAVRCSEQRLYSTWRRQRGALQLLWFRCKPLGYCQAGLEMRLNQLHDRMPPLQAPILTNMVVPASVASVASVRMCYGSKINRSTSSSRLICAVPFACAACTTCRHKLMT